MYRYAKHFLHIFLILSLYGSTVYGDGATIRGQFVQSDREGHQIDLKEFKIKLVQLIQLPQPELPGNWSEMSFEDRQKWLNEFEQTDEGKQLIAKQDQMLAERVSFDINVDDDGSWVVFDVPVGKYGIVNGRVNKVKDGVQYAYELFGTQVEVIPDVDEIALDPIQVLVTPLLESGAAAPDFKVSTHDKQGQMVLRHFKDKHLFIYFWATESPPSVAFFGQINQMYEQLKDKHELELLNINLDTERQKGIDKVIASKITGRHGFTDGLEHPMIDAYGIRSFPSLWLIGPEGKIVLSNSDFRRASLAGLSNLTEIVDLAIQGKPLPMPQPQPSKQSSTNPPR